MIRSPGWRVAHATWFAMLTLLLAATAFADVRFEGAWPDRENPVTLDAERLPRSEAVRQVADAMGWSIVLHAPTSDPVDLHVEEQPAAKVLSMLLSDHEYVARRDGTLISIERSASKEVDSPSASSPPPTAPTAPAAPAAPPPAAPAASASDTPVAELAPRGGPDRVISGSSVRVEKNEIVHDVVVFGGSADVLGTATGDVTVVGGSVTIHKDAHVMGDATAVGGSLTVEDGASVDGDVGVVGGVLHRGDKAKIGGAENSEAASGSTSRGNIGDWIAGVAASIGSAIARSALLFVFGAILLALGTRRMGSLQTELAARPMRTFALGVVGIIALILLIIAFTLTIVGIPVAVIGALLAVVAIYAGICAVLTVTGSILLRHKTHNPYIHLALGCLIFLVATAIPFLGNFVFLAVLLLGVGTLVATRGAGFFEARKRAHA